MKPLNFILFLLFLRRRDSTLSPVAVISRFHLIIRQSVTFKISLSPFAAWILFGASGFFSPSRKPFHHTTVFPVETKKGAFILSHKIRNFRENYVMNNLLSISFYITVNFSFVDNNILLGNVFKNSVTQNLWNDFIVVTIKK